MIQSEAKALVAVLRAAFPRQEMGETTFNVYVQDLMDLDYAAAAEACQTLRQTATFLPSIGEIRDMTARLVVGAPEPMHAWEQASGPAPRHELVDRARRMVGDAWHWRETPAHFLRKPFLEAYEEVLRLGVAEIAAPALAKPGPVAALEAGSSQFPRPAMQEIGKSSDPPLEAVEPELVQAPPGLLEKLSGRIGRRL